MPQTNGCDYDGLIARVIIAIWEEQEEKRVAKVATDVSDQEATRGKYIVVVPVPTAETDFIEKK